jgi:hypothetical protein
VLEALRGGDFGPEGGRAAEAYREACHQLFPLAVCFRDLSGPAPQASSHLNNSNNNNHVDHSLAAQMEELSVSS